MDGNEAERDLVSQIRLLLKASTQNLRAFRHARTAGITQFVGRHYGPAMTQPLPMNIICSGIMAMTPHLAPGVPKPGLTGKTPRAEQLSAWVGVRIEEWIDEEEFDEVLELVVADALFSIGVFWTGWTAGNLLEIGEDVLDAGFVKTRRVSLDDLHIDPRARTVQEATFIGHEAEVPLDWALDTFENVDGLIPDTDRDRGERRADDSMREHGRVQDPVCPTVRVDTLWWPHGLRGVSGPVLTVIPKDGQGDLFLRMEDYDGPNGGPYDFVQFHRVPDLLMPLAPIATYTDLHEMINRMARKMSRRLDREKIIALVNRSASAEEKTAIRNASDGDILQVADPEIAKELRLGGAPPEMANTLANLLAFASRMGGNLDLAGGLAPSADTLGQEQILASNASVRIDWMRRRIRKTLKRLFTKVGWYLYHDPLDDRTLERFVPGTDIRVRKSWTPEERDADFSDFQIDAEPYTQRNQDPDVQADRMEQWIAMTVMPLFEIAAAQGAEVDAAAVIRSLGRLRGVKGIERFFRMGGQPLEASIGPMGPQSRGTGQASPGGQITVRQAGARPAPASRGRPSGPPTTAANAG